MSFKDDLESLGYVIVYMITGKLPWKELATKNREEVLDQLIKLRDPKTLCQNLPGTTLSSKPSSLTIFLVEIGKYIKSV